MAAIPDLRIGIDLGGTKIALIAFDPDERVAFEKRVATPREDYAGTVEAIAALVAEAEATTGKRGTVGIGMPGSISPVDGKVQNGNSTWLNDQPFGRDLEAALGREVRLANDADCLALSENYDGAAAGAASSFAIILGTGCGAGVVINGHLLAGPNAIAGEWGHNPLPWPKPDEMPGQKCWCGKHGCLETWVAGPSFAADHFRVTGEKLDAATIIARAPADRQAQATLDRHLDRLGRAVAAIVNILDPHVIVLAGGLSNMPGLDQRLPGAVLPWVFARLPRVTVRKAVHGDASGVRGAARLWND